MAARRPSPRSPPAPTSYATAPGTTPTGTTTPATAPTTRATASPTSPSRSSPPRPAEVAWPDDGLVTSDAKRQAAKMDIAGASGKHAPLVFPRRLGVGCRASPPASGKAPFSGVVVPAIAVTRGAGHCAHADRKSV